MNVLCLIECLYIYAVSLCAYVCVSGQPDGCHSDGFQSVLVGCMAYWKTQVGVVVEQPEMYGGTKS